MARKTVCFIDDDPAELARFEKALGQRSDVVTASTWHGAERRLKKRGSKPALFVLDLYFPEEGHENAPEQLAEMNQRYFKLQQAIRSYRGYLRTIGQGPEGGMRLLEQCHSLGVPAVFLTRKGTLEDAVLCLEKKAAGVRKKPMPLEWPADPAEAAVQLDRAFESQASRLANAFDEVISQHGHWARYRHIYLGLVGLFAGVLVDRLVGLFW